MHTIHTYLLMGCTTVLQHCCTTVKTVRPYDVSDDDRRANVDSISREVRGIVSPPNRFANFSSFLTWASPTLIYYICIVRCKKSACSEPAQRNGQGASSYLNQYFWSHYAILTYLTYHMGFVPPTAKNPYFWSHYALCL